MSIFPVFEINCRLNVQYSMFSRMSWALNQPLYSIPIRNYYLQFDAMSSNIKDQDREHKFRWKLSMHNKKYNELTYWMVKYSISKMYIQCWQTIQFLIELIVSKTSISLYIHTTEWVTNFYGEYFLKKNILYKKNQFGFGV